jgi:hypothetical protein
MPNSVMVGRLRAKDEISITLSGNVRLILALVWTRMISSSAPA